MTVDAGPSRVQLLLSRLAAVLVALAGVAVLVSGLQRTSAFGGEAQIVGRLPAVTQPIVVTAPGVTDLAGATLRVRAASSAVSVPVFIGVGRADDVEAYLGRVARSEVTALEQDGALRVVAGTGEASLPDPSGVDVWAASVRAAGVGTLTWPRTPGPWRLVIATDGRTPPTAAEFTWSGRAGASPAPALIAIGAVLFVVGVAALLAMRSGRVLAAMGAGRPSRSEGAQRPQRPQGPPRPPSGRRAARHGAAVEPPVHQPVAVPEPVDVLEPVAEPATEPEPVAEPAAGPLGGAVDGNDETGDETDDAEMDDEGRAPAVLPFRRSPTGTEPADRPSNRAEGAERGRDA